MDLRTVNDVLYSQVVLIFVSHHVVAVLAAWATLQYATVILNLLWLRISSWLSSARWPAFSRNAGHYALSDSIPDNGDLCRMLQEDERIKCGEKSHVARNCRIPRRSTMEATRTYLLECGTPLAVMYMLSTHLTCQTTARLLTRPKARMRKALIAQQLSKTALWQSKKCMRPFTTIL